MSALTFGGQQVAAGFVWRTAGGEEYLRPADMRTRHLFNTFKMIWNHAVPHHQVGGRVKSYRFGPSYTADYMRSAIVALGGELFTRELSDWQRSVLAEMDAYFRDGPRKQVASEAKSAPAEAGSPSALGRMIERKLAHPFRHIESDQGYSA